MAAIYDFETNDELTVGLQGCEMCDEALIAAKEMAAEHGTSVELVDDDGRWEVKPNGTRSRLPNIETERTEDAWWTWHDADYSRLSPGEDPEEATADAEARCAAWVAGESDDGPED